MKRVIFKYFVLMFAFSFIGLLSGCGETVHGVVKDTGRIGKGVKTIFFRDKK